MLKRHPGEGTLVCLWVIIVTALEVDIVISLSNICVSVVFNGILLKIIWLLLCVCVCDGVHMRDIN